MIYNKCMKLGQVVLEKPTFAKAMAGKSAKEHKVVIRHMDKDDAEPMRAYINKLSKEQTFVTFQGEEVTIEEERDYTVGAIKKIESGAMVKLLLIVDGLVAGIAESSLGVRTHSHVGGFGLSIDSSVRGMGLGRLLLETTIGEAKKGLKGLRMVELSVFENNEIAINLYKSCGFVEVARIPEKIFYKGDYIDEIVMVLKV